jgi:hypothetical protein
MRGQSLCLLMMAAVIPLAAACGSSGPHAARAARAVNASPASAAASEPAPSISAPPGAVVTGPNTVRMGRFTEVFATPLPTVAAEVSVASDFREAMLLWDDSQERRTLVAPVTSYVTGDALKNLRLTITRFAQEDEVPAGTDRFFKTTVVAVTSPTAMVTSCDDGSKDTMIKLATNTVDPSWVNLPLDQQYVYVTWDMALHAGHWAITSISALNPPAAAAKQCLPGGH